MDQVDDSGAHAGHRQVTQPDGFLAGVGGAVVFTDQVAGVVVEELQGVGGFPAKCGVGGDRDVGCTC